MIAVAAPRCAACNARFKGCGAVRRQRVCSTAALRLVPTGNGTLDHLDDEDVPLPEPIDLQEGLFEVGRAPPADLVIPIPTISVRHAMLRVGGSTLEVTDLGSTNGTYIEGQELKPTQAAELGVGQEVTFGDEYLAKFRLDAVEDPVEDPAPADSPTADA